MIVKNLLWMLPFIFFLAGYCITRSFFHGKEIEVPSLVGKKLSEAFQVLSHNQLTMQLLEQKEDADLEDGTILFQIPVAKQWVKPRQTVFVVISKQPPSLHAPLLQGKQLTEIEQLMHSLKVKTKLYYLESTYPTHSCIAQIPVAGESITDQTMILYLSKGNTHPIIWPNFIGKPLQTVIEFLENYHIEPQVIPPAIHPGENVPFIIDQRPLAGSIIALDEKRPPIVQLFTH